MLDLSSVTLWAMVWANDRQWITKIGKVLRYCHTIARFNRTILFVHDQLAPRSYPWDVIKIPALTWPTYNQFINREVPKHILGGHALSVHEDGFILDVSLWDPRFLEFDYIGAPWTDGVVGNGGFNMESRKLLELKLQMPRNQDDLTLPSDRLVCSARRTWLEERGVRFAPVDLALKFSTELMGNEKPSFGFHGRTCCRQKYDRGWGLISMSEATFRGGFWKVGNQVVPHWGVPR